MAAVDGHSQTNFVVKIYLFKEATTDLWNNPPCLFLRIATELLILQNACLAAGNGLALGYLDLRKGRDK